MGTNLINTDTILISKTVRIINSSKSSISKIQNGLTMIIGDKDMVAVAVVDGEMVRILVNYSHIHEVNIAYLL